MKRDIFMSGSFRFKKTVSGILMKELVKNHKNAVKWR